MKNPDGCTPGPDALAVCRRVPVQGRAMFTRVLAAPGTDAGVPIVLVHGAVISGRYMLPLARRLATTRPVLIPDLPGFGESEDPPAPLPFDGLVEALLAWLDAADVPRAHLVGHSLGAQLVAALAERAPARVAALVLLAPTVDASGRTRWSQLVRLARDAFRERPSLVLLHARDVLRAGWRFATSTLRIALGDRIEERLPGLDLPVLVVAGDCDPVAPVAWCRRLAALLRDGRFVVIPGPHGLNYSRASETAEAIERFLDGRSGGADRVAGAAWPVRRDGRRVTGAA